MAAATTNRKRNLHYDEGPPMKKLKMTTEKINKKRTRKKKTWEERYEALVAFKQKYGHCRVPQHFPEDRSLASFVDDIRCGRAKTSPQQKERLDQLGFDFEKKDVKNERKWREMFERLKAYRLEYTAHDGSCRSIYLPTSIKEYKKYDPKHHQRSHQRIGKLLPHREMALNSIGFAWSTIKRNIVDEGIERSLSTQQQEEQMAALQASEAEAAAEAPISSQTTPAAVVVTHQYRNIQNPIPCGYQHIMFNGSRPVLAAPPTTKEGLQQQPVVPTSIMTVNEQKWLVKYNKLVDFHREYGHCVVPRTYKDKSLAIFVNKQRALYKDGILKNGRKKLLEELQFVWKVDKAHTRRRPVFS